MDAFLDQLDLNDVILVLHDWGGALGFHGANNHRQRISGVTFFEAMIASYATMEEWFGPFSKDPENPALSDLMTLFRSGVEGDTDPNSAWQAIAVRNMFLQGLVLMMMLTRTLSEVEIAAYQKPFPTEASRKPIWKWPREIPIGGLTVEGSSFPHEAILSYRAWLETSSIPKLHLIATPGALNLKQRDLPWIRTLPNISVVSFGPGLHFLQEDNPHKIGLEIIDWFEQNF